MRRTKQGSLARGLSSMAGVALIAALLPSAAAANHLSGWTDAGSGIPASVDLKDVSTAPGGIVIAVGQQSGAIDGSTATVYRRAGGNWIADNVQLPPGAHDSRLVDVASSPVAAWAVGTYVDGTNTSRALVLRLASQDPSTALSSAQAAGWAQPDSLQATMALPRSVALYGGAGLIGDSAGGIYPIHDSGATSGIDAAAALTPPNPAAPPGAINGVAMYSDTAGYAVADSSTNGHRIFRVNLTQPATFVSADNPATPTDTANIVSVAAADQSNGLAVEGPAGGATAPGYWSPDTNPVAPVWGRFTDPLFTNGTSLKDASLALASGTKIEAIAGDDSGTGVVWRRSGSGWSRDDKLAVDYAVTNQPLSASALNGVAVISQKDIWAVGDGGVVRHYAALPDEPPPPPPVRPVVTILSGPSQGATIPSPTTAFSFEADQAQATFECSVDGVGFTPCTSPKSVHVFEEGEHTFQVRADAHTSAGLSNVVTRTFYVDVPNCPTPSPLATSVRVVKKTHNLRVYFQLAAKAKVRAIARAHHRTVGKTSWLTLDKGSRRVNVRFNAPPTTLQLIAKPATNCDF
ncbi:MAG: hypothetical protein QOJ38_969 [Solirubrobacterales bacterium]|nr:hypothetical protein [Solirubrobacterales bacterium]